jgi:hypothetical protein
MGILEQMPRDGHEGFDCMATLYLAHRVLATLEITWYSQPAWEDQGEEDIFHR